MDLQRHLGILVSLVFYLICKVFLNLIDSPPSLALMHQILHQVDTELFKGELDNEISGELGEILVPKSDQERGQVAVEELKQTDFQRERCLEFLLSAVVFD